VGGLYSHHCILAGSNKLVVDREETELNSERRIGVRLTRLARPLLYSNVPMVATKMDIHLGLPFAE
jgi:hypothetical protein